MSVNEGYERNLNVGEKLSERVEAELGTSKRFGLKVQINTPLL